MRSTIKKFGLAALLLTFFVGCVQPPAPVNSDFEVSDEAGNTVTTQAVPTNGLKGEYYDNVDFTGTMKTRYDATVNRNPGTAAPITGIQPTTYSVRWTGQIMPAFSETYTFTLSYADGARLMVNGQMLVNDWVDGAKRTKTGTVALQANTKYDIRLEYYRNATNPGTIKIEWQSPSRSKQVVPKANLFPSGTGAEAAWNAIKLLPASGSLNASVYLESALLYRQGQKQFFWAAEKNQTATITAVFSGSEIVYARRYRFSDEKIIVTDLKTNRTLDFGTISDFYDRNDSNDSLQKKLYQDKEQELLKLEKTIYRISPQSVPSGYCATCRVFQEKYLFSSATLAAFVWQTGLYYGLSVKDCVNTPSVESCIKGLIGSVSIDLAMAGFNASKLFDDVISAAEQATQDLMDWENCKKTETCPYIVTGPTPSNMTLKTQVGATVSGKFELRNIGAWDVFVKESTGSPQLKLSATGTSAQSTIDGFRSLGQFTTMEVTVSATCKSGGVFTENVNLEIRGPLDPSFNQTRQVSVTLECEGPKISVSPSSISLEAGLNTYSDRGFISITNVGSGDLKITDVNSVSTWITISQDDIDNINKNPIPAKATSYIRFRATCANTIETRTAIINVLHNDEITPQPIKISVSISCIPSSVMVTMTKTDFFQKGGCQQELCYDPPPLEGDISTFYTVKNITSKAVKFKISGWLFDWGNMTNAERAPFYGLILQPYEEKTYLLVIRDQCFDTRYATKDKVSNGEIWQMPFDPLDYSHTVIGIAPQYVIHCNPR